MKNDSIQRKLGRIRAPRVQITYDLEIGDAAEKRQLPMVVGVISPLSGPQRKSGRTNTNAIGFEQVSRQGLDGLMTTIEPQLLLQLPSCLQAVMTSGVQSGRQADIQPTTLSVQLRFEALRDFHPDAIVNQVPELSEMVKRRAQLLALRSRLAGQPGLQKWVRQHLEGLALYDQEPLP
jgi:type VI secretion system protein ImpB